MIVDIFLWIGAAAIIAISVYFVWDHQRLAGKGDLPPPGFEGPWLKTMERRQAAEVVELLREVIETARNANEAFDKMRQLVDPPKKGPRPDAVLGTASFMPAQALLNIALQYAGIKPKETLEEYARRIGQTPRPPRILLEEDED
jgi:hypothetical protein